MCAANFAKKNECKMLFFSIPKLKVCNWCYQKIGWVKILVESLNLMVDRATAWVGKLVHGCI